MLTASGGPFRTWTAERIARASVDEALAHPNWSMGPKITIDSATLMNKGLEVIEARWLFDTTPERIDVVVHPQSVVHSLVELCDGSVLAQLGVPDMRVPIAVALAWPERLPLLGAASGLARELPPLDLAVAARLDFETPDRKRFPCLDLAYAALRGDEAAPAALERGERGVGRRVPGACAFRSRRSRRPTPPCSTRIWRARGCDPLRDLDDVLEADAWARARARGAALCGGRCMTALSFVFAFVLMLGVLIFVHELGHFLVAKLFDVKVLKFSLGFGPAIGIGRWRLAFTRGETEYVVAWFPLGGFVKMLGENPEDEVRAPASAGDAAEGIAPPEPLDPADIPRAFNNKPAWQRLLVLFAGPGMNLLLPVVIFAGVLAAGMPRPEPVIGTIEPNSPAARAGLAVGDRVVAVGGEPVQWWDDVEDDLRARPGESVPIRVQRGAQTIDASLSLEDRAGMDAVGAPAQIGWAGLGHSRLAAVVGIPTANAPANATELRSGDRVVAVAGEAVEDWVGFASRYAAASGGGVAVRVARLEDGRTEPRTLELTLPALGSADALGVVPATVLVAGTTPGSPAEEAGLRGGDLIVAVDGAPVGSFAAFSELVRASGGRALQIAYARAGERREIPVSPQLLEADTGLGIPEERYLIGITAHAASVQGAVGIDQETNPLVSVPRAAGMTAELTRTFLGGLKRLVSGDVSRKQLAGPIGIAEIAHNAFEQGWFAYLTTLILISINLAVLNLLPIPVLDGGQALLIAIEGVKRSPLSIRTREIVQQIGVTVMVMLMGLAFWNDLSRHWSRFVDWVRHSAGL